MTLSCFGAGDLHETCLTSTQRAWGLYERRNPSRMEACPGNQIMHRLLGLAGKDKVAESPKWCPCASCFHLSSVEIRIMALRPAVHAT
jgi:hypothetical protein